KAVVVGRGEYGIVRQWVRPLPGEVRAQRRSRLQARDTSDRHQHPRVPLFPVRSKIVPIQPAELDPVEMCRNGAVVNGLMRSFGRRRGTTRELQAGRWRALAPSFPCKWARGIKMSIL